MRKKALYCGIFVLFIIFLFACLGCNYYISYPFHYDETEIKDICIIHTLDDYGYKFDEYEIILKIEDKDEFITKFKEIRFRRFEFGDPSEVGSNINAILIEYYNGDFEIVIHNAHDVIIDGERWCYGRANCNKEEFENFINSYLPLDS